MMRTNFAWLATMCFLVVAYPKPGLSSWFFVMNETPVYDEPLHTTTESELKKSSDSLYTDWSITSLANQNFFSHFEKQIQSYIDDCRRWQMTVISNKSRLLEEIDDYISRLPRNASKIVNTKIRDVCHCDGQMMKPCPVKCMYSCYAQNSNAYTSNNGWRYEEDCRGIRMHSCLCQKNSPTSCADGNSLHRCFNETTKVVQADSSCSQFSIHKPNLVRSYELILNLLIQPMKMYFRGVESWLRFLEQASSTINSLSSIAALRCSDQDDAVCTADVDQLIYDKKTIYRKMKKDFTHELIHIQRTIEAVSGIVDRLKRATIASINRSIKEYSCYLKALDITVEEYNRSGISYPTKPAICDPPCQNGGHCVGNNQCLCPPNTSGENCQNSICDPPCQNGGHCVGNNQCLCPPNTSGENCQNSICDPPCQNGGHCVGNNQCLCPPNTSGENCQNSICDPPCQNGGHCVGNNQCLCPPNTSGENCQNSICDPPCQNGGHCVGNNQCLCPPNTSGENCQNFPECRCDPLGSDGPCDSEGQCSCKPQFEGKYCDRCQDGIDNYPLCEEIVTTAATTEQPPEVTTVSDPRTRCITLSAHRYGELSVFMCESDRRHRSYILCGRVCDGEKDCNDASDEIGC